MNDIKGIIEDVEKGELVSDKIIKKVREIIGQEEWNDLFDEQNDIITTTGELIITLKRIPDLEKENTELQERYDKVDIIGYDALKNLTKAKELLNEFMRISKASDEDFEHDYSELIRETEQFIKGENIILEDAQAGNSPFDADEVFHKEMKTYPEEK